MSVVYIVSGVYIGFIHGDCQVGKSKYHHGDLRRALVEAAVELAIENGPDGVSMREAGRRAGVSTAAPYRHFRDRDELMSAVAAEGHQRSLDFMKRAADGCEEPMEQYHAYGVNYVMFAIENPQLFRVMQVARWCQSEASPEMAKVNEASDESMMGLVLDACESGGMTSDALVTQMLASHVLVYGLARFYVDGHAERWGMLKGDPQQVVEAVVNVLGRGLAPRPETDLCGDD